MNNRIEEYNNLRNELLHIIKMRKLFYYVYILIIIAFIPKLYSEFSNLLSVTFLFISYITILQYKKYTFNMIKISTYIRLYIEPKTEGLGFEKKLDSFKNELRTGKSVKKYRFNLKLYNFILKNFIHLFSLTITSFCIYDNLLTSNVNYLYLLIYITFFCLICHEIWWKDSKEMRDDIEIIWSDVEKKQKIIFENCRKK